MGKLILREDFFYHSNFIRSLLQFFSWNCFFFLLPSNSLYLKHFWGRGFHFFFFPWKRSHLFLHLSSESIETQSLNLSVQITKEFYFIPITVLIVFLRFHLFGRNFKLLIKIAWFQAFCLSETGFHVYRNPVIGTFLPSLEKWHSHWELGY